MPDYLKDEIPMLPTDGVSPIDSLNKYFFLDWKGVKRNHVRFLNFFKHSNLFDVELPYYTKEEVYNIEPKLYKTSLDEFGHTVRIIEMPACIKVEDTPLLWNIMNNGDGTYSFPTSLNSTQYTNLMNAGKLLTNVIYQIPKPTTETVIHDNQGREIRNANNAFYEYMISSITYNSNTGMYDIVWEMLGGKELTVDSSLSSTSTNPVENRVIYNEIGNVQAILATLTTP